MKNARMSILSVLAALLFLFALSCTLDPDPNDNGDGNGDGPGNGGDPSGFTVPGSIGLIIHDAVIVTQEMIDDPDYPFVQDDLGQLKVLSTSWADYSPPGGLLNKKLEWHGAVPETVQYPVLGTGSFQLSTGAFSFGFVTPNQSQMGQVFRDSDWPGGSPTGIGTIQNATLFRDFGPGDPDQENWVIDARQLYRAKYSYTDSFNYSVSVAKWFYIDTATSFNQTFGPELIQTVPGGPLEGYDVFGSEIWSLTLSQGWNKIVFTETISVDHGTEQINFSSSYTNTIDGLQWILGFNRILNATNMELPWYLDEDE